MKRTYTTRLDGSLIYAVKMEAVKKNVAASDIIQEAIEKYLDAKNNAKGKDDDMRHPYRVQQNNRSSVPAGTIDAT